MLFPWFRRTVMTQIGSGFHWVELLKQGISFTASDCVSKACKITKYTKLQKELR